MKFINICFLFCACMFLQNGIFAQDLMTKAELVAKRDAAAAELAKYQAEVDALNGKIEKIPGWRKGLVGVVGADFNGNNNWFALATPNAKSNGLGIGVNGFANLIQDKYFWRNLLNINVQRTQTKATPDAKPAIALSQGLDLSSLYGYRLTPKFAISAEGKYTTAILNYLNDKEEYALAFNNPGKLTFSAGATWTPMDNLVVLIHPLGYELNMPGELRSSPGAKIGATYAAKILRGISWTSNLSAFIPYGGAGEVQYESINAALGKQTVDYKTSELMNYTWLNGFSMKIFNGITVALNVGLRGDNQIADKGQYATIADLSKISTKGLKLQSYYTLGLGYTF